LPVYMAQSTFRIWAAILCWTLTIARSSAWCVIHAISNLAPQKHWDIKGLNSQMISKIPVTGRGKGGNGFKPRCVCLQSLCFSLYLLLLLDVCPE
jgi:hypothetical protein